MAAPSVLVIRAAGINCDEEVMHCWRLAGATPTLMHVNDLARHPALLDDFIVVTIPGGFSYGDDLGAGAILAQRMQYELAEPLRKLVARGGGILGICNGFQVLAKMGLLPGGEFGRDTVTVTYNDSAKFEARWVKLQVCVDHCPYLTRAAGLGPRDPVPPAADLGPRDHAVLLTEGAGRDRGGSGPFSRPRGLLEMPVEHAEGKVVVADDATAQRLLDAGLVALRYVDEQGRFDRYPANPNGSTLGIAGLCDATGRVFGLMPHPDRHFDHTQHPCWTRRNPQDHADGLRIFQNAVRHWTH